MTSVVIVHAAENALPARALAEKLRAMGLVPVIETPPGDALRQAMEEASAVVGLWSAQSAASAPLLAEAEAAARQGKLINARMQSTPPPSQFASLPTIDLTGWRGEDAFPGWRDLRREVEAKVAAAPVRTTPPPPAPAREAPPAPLASPRPASSPAAAAQPPRTPPPGFFVPGAAGPGQRREASPAAALATHQPDAPPPRPAVSEPTRLADPPPTYVSVPHLEAAEPEPARRSPNLVLIGLGTFLAVALIGGGGFVLVNRMQSTQAAETAWNAIDQADPAALRAFLSGPSVGQFQDEAQAALDALELERLNAARATDTIPALERFLAEFPGSRHALEINGRIAELRAAPPQAEPNIDPVTGLPIDQTTPVQIPQPGETPAAAPGAAAPAAPSAPAAPAAPPAPAAADPAPAPSTGEAPILLAPPGAGAPQ